MEFREETKDLFLVPQGYYLAHCISGDYALGAGIAKQFVEKYNMRTKLVNQYPLDAETADCDCYKKHVGEALLVDNVFNLVTKERYFHKPKYYDLRNSLKDMKMQMDALDITKLAIPLIGCGLDRLEWDEVKASIEDIFADTDVEILVCVL